MRLLFVDDSGNPRGKRAVGDIGLYILAGLAVDDRDLPSIIKAASDAKAAMCARMGIGESEMHAHDIWNDTGQFRGKGKMLTMQQKLEMFSSMVNVVTLPRWTSSPWWSTGSSLGSKTPDRKSVV